MGIKLDTLRDKKGSTMNRRELLKTLGLFGLTSSLAPWSQQIQAADFTPYSGPLYMMINARGGWDVTSFCDPKVNQPGERVINNWANQLDIRQAGNIPYAPFANNQEFFEKYYPYMMVVNGIDAQTNSHDAGVTHNWSGRLSAGYPSFGAQISAINGPTLPMAYISNGGYSETADLIRFTRLDSPEVLKSLLIPNQASFGSTASPLIDTLDWEKIMNAQQQQLSILTEQSNLLPSQLRNRINYANSIDNSDGLDGFIDLIPDNDDLQPRVDEFGNFAPLKQQAQIALLAFKSGISLSCDLSYAAFDTHDNHDTDHSQALSHLTDSIGYLWEFAEELEIADRLTVYIASDFARTPYYNSDNGKDHWPIGSSIIMQKDAPCGNRVVSATDEGHNALAINPNNLAPNNEGNFILPGHLMKAMRSLAGIENHPLLTPFAFSNLEAINFFNSPEMT